MKGTGKYDKSGREMMVGDTVHFRTSGLSGRDVVFLQKSRIVLERTRSEYEIPGPESRRGGYIRIMRVRGTALTKGAVRMDKAFIVKEHWGNLILNGSKPWEIRGIGTQVRGRVGVIFSGTGMIQGSVEIVGSSLLLKEDFDMFRKYHHISGNFDSLTYEESHIWYLKDAIRFTEPIPYRHPRGAVIWVSLEGRM